MDDKDCLMIDIRFQESEKSEYEDRWEHRIVAMSASSKVKDLCVFMENRGDGVIVSQESVICVGLNGVVKRYDRSGSTVVGHLTRRLLQDYRIIACKDNRLTVISSNGLLKVFEYTMESARIAIEEDIMLQMMRLGGM